jgi:O-antigen ligase
LLKKYLLTPKTKLFSIIFCFALLYNNIFRWYPFGKSLNDFQSLESNFLGIAVNFFIYILIFLLFIPSAFKDLNFPGRLLFLYLFLGVILSFFRHDFVLELERSVLMFFCYFSAHIAGSYIAKNFYRLQYFFRSIAVCFLFIDILGLLIGLLLPGSVNFGYLNSYNYLNKERAEFFYFYSGVVFNLAAISLALSVNSFDKVKSFGVSIIYASTLFCLLLTRTRSAILTLLIFLLIFYWYKIKEFFSYFNLWLILLSVINVSNLFIVLSIYGLKNFLRINFDNDLTNGRYELFQFIKDIFYSNPFFGIGQSETKRLIWESTLRAKTEHGYIFHAASYGIISFILYAYFIIVFISSIYNLKYNHSAPEMKRYLSFISALSFVTLLLGFTGLFASSSAFYDWIAIFICSISLSFAVAYKYNHSDFYEKKST